MRAKDINITQIIKEFSGVDVTNKKVKCPFCSSSNGFSVNTSKNFFKCFGACNNGGDGISFVSAYLGCNTIDAITEINKKFGLGDYKTNSENSTKTARAEIFVKSEKQSKKSPDTEVNNEFISYLSTLELSPSCAAYFERRGFKRSEIKEYNLCAIDFKRDYQKVSNHMKKRFSSTQLIESGLFNENGNLIFGGDRIIIPYMFDGNCLNITARSIKDVKGSAKYLNLKDVMKVPFNLDAIERAKDCIYILEGAFDAMSLEIMTEIEELNGVGVKAYAVALGSTSLPEPQYRRLIRKIGEKGLLIKFLFDNDTAGGNMAKNGSELFGNIIKLIKESGYKYEVNIITTDYKDLNEMYIASIS